MGDSMYNTYSGKSVHTGTYVRTGREFKWIGPVVVAMGCIVAMMGCVACVGVL